MRALSVRQPWADLIARGLKNIEIRSWATSHRGPLLICASAKKYGDLPVGVAICVVDMVNVRPITEADRGRAQIGSDFDLRGQNAWEIVNPRPVKPTPIKGCLHLFEVPDEMIK